MADQSHRSVLDIVLKDDVSPEAKVMAEALLKAAAQARQLDEILQRSGTSTRFQDNLKRIGATVPKVEGATKALRALADAEGIAADRSGWTADQAKQFKNLEAVTVATVRAQMRAEDAQAKARQEAVAQQQRQAAVAADAEMRQAERAAIEAERQKKAETEYVIREMRRRAQERARIAEAEMREAARVSAAEAREAKQAADAVIREAEREARETARIRAQEIAAAHREQERAAEQRQHAIERGGFSHFALGAAAGAVSAHGVVSATESTLEAGMGRQSALVAAQRAGIEPQDRQHLVEIARHEARNGVLTVEQAIDIAKEARSAVVDPREVEGLLPDLMKAATIMKANGTEGSIADLVKAGETLSLMNDPKRFRRYLDSQVRAMTVLGHTISPEQAYEAAKYSKSAGATLSDDFLNLTMPSVIQELHGSSAGDALSALAKRWRGGLAHQHLAVQMLQEQGLLADPGKIVRAKGSGEIMGYTGKLVGDELLKTDPDRFFQEVWRPAADRIGVHGLGDQIALLNKELPQTAANLGRIFLQQEEALRQHRQNSRNAMGLADSIEALKSDPKLQIEAFNAALTDLQATVTSGAMGALGLNLNKLSGWIRDLEGVAAQHPRAALGIGATALSAGLAGSGFMAYQFSRGFGLTSSAAALKTAAAAQSEAAAALSRAAGLESAAAEAETSAAAKAVAATPAGLGKANAINLVANSVALFGLAKSAADAHIFDEQQRSGWRGMVEFLDPGIASRLFGPADKAGPSDAPAQSRDDAVSATAPAQGRTNIPSAGDNSALGQGTGRGFLHKSAYFEGDRFGMTFAEAIIARGTQAGFEAALRNLLAGGTTNGAGSAANLIQASYETGDGIAVRGSGARMSAGAGARSSLPSLRYGRDAGGHYRFSPESIDHFTAAGKTFASKSPDVMRHLMKDFGLGPEQAAVILGNLGHESAGFTAFHEGGKAAGAGGIGWAQWTGSRRREYEAWTQANHLDPRSDEANYGFLKHELTTNPRYGRALDVLRASKGTPQDLMNFEKVFEGAGIKAYGSRWAYDRKALQALRDSEHDIAGREPQGPRLPERAPKPRGEGMTTALNDAPVSIFDHGHLHETEHLLDRITEKVARLGNASVSVVHGPRENGQRSQLASRGEVGRQIRSVASTSGSSFV